MIGYIFVFYVELLSLSGRYECMTPPALEIMLVSCFLKIVFEFWIHLLVSATGVYWQ